jgi:signal recognition particle receptor subunit beta
MNSLMMQNVHGLVVLILSKKKKVEQHENKSIDIHEIADSYEPTRT